ncbi:MAG: hypothetical protein ACKN83_09425 [Vulcanococcus sp.]
MADLRQHAQGTESDPVCNGPGELNQAAGGAPAQSVQKNLQQKTSSKKPSGKAEG